MHMAQPPTERERRVLYSGFSLPPFPDIDREAISAGRARLGTFRGRGAAHRARPPLQELMHQFDALDEYPIHQVPLPMRYTGTSDRNFYDRCIYQGVDREADTFFITGLGVYPNLGVIDAFATVRRGDRQWAVRASGSRPDDRMAQEVGPYRIEVVEPFHALRFDL
jgi:hypothetical protein